MSRTGATPPYTANPNLPILEMPVEYWLRATMPVPMYQPNAASFLTQQGAFPSPPLTAPAEYGAQTSSKGPAAGSHILSLAEAIVEPAQATNVQELPSLGSAGHRHGTCKPCSFFFRAGCSPGPQCEYCHLCDAGEKKRRLRKKRELLRDAHLQGARLLASGGV